MDLSILESELIEQYYREQRALAVHEEALASCRKGYISVKFINDRPQYYLQWREGATVRSKYIKSKDYVNVKNEIAARKEHEKSIKHIKKNMKQIERVVGKKKIDEFRDLAR